MIKTRRFFALALVFALATAFVPATLAAEQVDLSDFATADGVIVGDGEAAGQWNENISISLTGTNIE